MAGTDAGLELDCPRCGQPVRQKAMIPIAGDGGALGYLCVPCARTLVVRADAADGAAAVEDAAPAAPAAP